MNAVDSMRLVNHLTHLIPLFSLTQRKISIRQPTHRSPFTELLRDLAYYKIAHIHWVSDGYDKDTYHVVLYLFKPGFPQKFTSSLS